ncbi:putative pectinesterase/pectinesterase inhibitor 22 [Vigna radiata var. radiata]|uniref:Pectinesterase/pectinesterase inhibitor 22 n=1 Tax=Vigna radiata var. radiata TaxID=3916 RepID=A0A1S3TFP7_VIGRR|nr:putative pectinesterase/pectinesterase inhibitor 22 [Vigna radiata var. radiata]
MKATLNEATMGIDNMKKITTFSVSYRKQQAIEDCKELLHFSVSELAWSLGEMRRIRAGDTNLQSEGNLEAWLSVALSNQDTRLEGFKGINIRLKSYISGSLTQVTQLINNVLSLAKPHGVRADTVVALDGSGHCRSIAEAVNVAPSQSERRYITYVKKGLYNENIDIKKKMTNIMLVGDGIGQTIITNNRNFIQGWTTFRVHV